MQQAAWHIRLAAWLTFALLAWREAQGPVWPAAWACPLATAWNHAVQGFNCFHHALAKQLTACLRLFCLTQISCYYLMCIRREILKIVIDYNQTFLSRQKFKILKKELPHKQILFTLLLSKHSCLEYISSHTAWRPRKDSSREKGSLLTSTFWGLGVAFFQ